MKSTCIRCVLMFWSLFLVEGAWGGSLDLVKDGKSDYSIVRPDISPNRGMEDMAKLVSEAIFRSTGVRLAVVRESEAPAGPAIYLGPVSKLGALPEMAHHEAHVEVRGNDVYLYGSDRNYFKDSNHINYREWGSYRAAALFLRKTCNADVLFPGGGFRGLYVDKKDGISLPDDYSVRDVPEVLFNIGRFHGLYFDVFNGHLPSSWYGEYGGHSHLMAVPQAKYFDTHPEYFALVNGKRRPGAYNQLCLSNPEVQKLIYQNVLDHLDQGFTMVQLSQCDGWYPCQCEDCAKMYGILPKAKPEDGEAYENDPAWGEKLWRLHLGMAERLLKDRPGMKVCVPAYGKTRRPPTGITKFPANVCVDLAPWLFDSLSTTWKGYSVPGGFVCYDYTFGSYNEMGFTPKKCLAFLTQHARQLHTDGILGVYRSGWGDMFGIDGPFYFAWNRMIMNPKLEPQDLIHEYCTRMYGAAAPEMEEFIRIQNERVTIELKKERKDTMEFGSSALLANKLPDKLVGDRRNPGLPKNPEAIALLLDRWPMEVIDKMEALLAKAEPKLPKDENTAFFWPVVKGNFIYLKLLAAVINAREDARSEVNVANFTRLMDASEARMNFIEAIPFDRNGRSSRVGEMQIYASLDKASIYHNGRLRGIINLPFPGGGLKEMRASGIVPFARVIHTGESQAQRLVGFNAEANKCPDIWNQPIDIRCDWTPEALTVTLSLPKGMPQVFREKKNSIFTRIFIGKDNTRRFRIEGTHAYRRLTERSKTLGVNGAIADYYDGPVIPSSVQSRSTAPDTLTMTIPWKDVAIVPEKGMKLQFNVYAQYSNDRGFIWEYNPFQYNWRNPCDRAGTLVLD